MVWDPWQDHLLASVLKKLSANEFGYISLEQYTHGGKSVIVVDSTANDLTEEEYKAVSKMLEDR